ncbi:MAG: tRNA(Ile)(2)-agmatinylcytidine synthase, partial [Thermoplasmata archaeon]
MWIGVDDTDSSEGMCTTYLAPKILLKLNLDLIGFPRLVRLNPNIPWKTRGNAAIALRVGKGIGEKRKVGEFKGEEIYSYQRGKEVDYDNILDNVKEIVEKFAIFDDKKTSPGIVITKKKLTEKIYWKAVRSVINLDEIYNYIENTQFFGYKSKRGLIGASAAISWKPKKKTYELITYLPREKWLDERFVDKFSVIEMDKKITSTFENYDYKNDHVAIKPETKTPVLFGIRGIDPWDLFKALSIVKSDPYDGYIIFETNQGTDDHLVKKRISQIKPYDSVIVNGIINSKPRIIKGGHVIFSIKDPTGEIECAAY